MEKWPTEEMVHDEFKYYNIWEKLAFDGMWNNENLLKPVTVKDDNSMSASDTKHDTNICVWLKTNNSCKYMLLIIHIVCFIKWYVNLLIYLEHMVENKHVKIGLVI